MTIGLEDMVYRLPWGLIWVSYGISRSRSR